MDFDIIPYGDIVWGQRLGAGSFGSVYKGSYLGIDIAIKEVLPSTEYDVHKYFEREWRIMRECRHPNIVLFLGLSKAPEDDGRFFIISEFVPRGNLRQYILSSHPFPWRLRLSFATDIARAVAYLHARQCIHRDLKGENLLITSNERVKVTDFGFARIASRNAEEMRRMTYCGTDGYMSPEIINGLEFDLPTDVFSLGIIFIEIISRRLVDSKTYTAQRKAPHFTPEPAEVHRRASPGCPPSLISLALACTQEDPAIRPLMPEVLHKVRDIEREVLSRLEDATEHVGSIRLIHRSGKRAMPIFDVEPKDEEAEEKEAEEEVLRKLAEIKVDVGGGGASSGDEYGAKDGEDGEEKWRTARWEEMPSLMTFRTASSEMIGGHTRLLRSSGTSSSFEHLTVQSVPSAYSDNMIQAAQPVQTASTLNAANPKEEEETNASSLTVRGVPASSPIAQDITKLSPEDPPKPIKEDNCPFSNSDIAENSHTKTSMPFVSEIETIPSVQDSIIPTPRKGEALRRKNEEGGLGTHRFTLVEKDSMALINRNNGKKSLSSGFTSTFAFAFLPRSLTSASSSYGASTGSGKCAVCSKRVGQRPGLECDDCHIIVHVKCSHAAPRNCTGGDGI
ncbi:hypothetical protein IAR55_006448 [Kwoniella newhampshirensis]|uniref:TKL/LISK/LISK-DD1 protein kinase n=1 Tax=Kwoniella newhampshirensis TaxID=1651941 RepID=A0AAW0YTA7_9TREE